MPSALIHYFSGTGNTYHVVQMVERKLKSSGFDVRVRAVESGAHPPGEKFDLHVFAFPVYACDVPDVMLRYMRRLPGGSGSKAAVIAINGSIHATTRIPGAQGDPGYSYDHAYLILKLKGYDVFFTDAAAYPHSITEMIPPPALIEQQKIRELSDKRAEVFAEKIAAGEKRVKHNLWLLILYLPFGWGYNLIGRRFLGKLYVADGSCISCGKCVKACPAKAIRLVGGKPRWNWDCEGCQRCINICPQASIQGSFTRLMVFFVLLVLPLGDWLKSALSYVPVAYPAGAAGVAVDMLLWLIGFSIIFYVLEKVWFLLERTPVIRRIVEMNFTNTYQRYIGPGFSPLEKGR